MRHTYFVKKKKYCFQLQTLLTSFSGPPIMLSGGRFFGLHRPFLLTVSPLISTSQFSIKDGFFFRWLVLLSRIFLLCCKWWNWAEEFFYSLQYVPQGRIVQLATIKEIIFSWLCGLEGSTSLCFTKSFPTGLEATTHLGLHFKDEKFKVSFISWGILGY